MHQCQQDLYFFYKNNLDLIPVLYYYYKKLKIGVSALVFLFFLTSKMIWPILA